MNENPSIKLTATILPFLPGIVLMLSCNAFAAKTDVATQAELDAAVAAQATVDTGQNTTISTQGASISALQAEIANLKVLIEKYHPTPKKIGDFYGGGIVFYVDDTGQHGLIASLSDQSAGIQWYNGEYEVTGAKGDGIGAGAMNTAIIIPTQIDNLVGDFPNFAALVAVNYSVQEDCVAAACTESVVLYGDWYLPSRYELNLMYKNIGQDSPLGNVGGFVDSYYWSSTEDGSFSAAWYQNFSNGYQGDASKNSSLRVRAIRAF